MKKPGLILSIIISLLVFSFCNKENNVVDDVIPVINQPPLKPHIEIVKLNYNSATIVCNKVSDPDKDVLYYSLFIGDSTIFLNSTSDFVYKIEGLEPETTYSGSVSITDSVNDPVESKFTFTTSKYIIRFSKTYTSLLGDTGSGYSIEFTDDGGYIILGTISHSTHYLYALKVDSLGYEMWHKFYDIQCACFEGEIIKVSNGNYVIVTQKHVIMIDPFGEIVWHFQKEGYADYMAVVENEYNELFVAGITSLKASLSKFSLTGEEIWERHYHGENKRAVSSLCMTHDNHLMVFGTTRGEGDNDFWITKLDQNGEEGWEKVYEDPDFAFAEQIITCQDNGFAMVGQTWGNMDVATSRILKVDANGNLQWDKPYRWDSFKTNARSLVQNRDGTFVFCGENGYSPAEAILVKLSQSGDLVWKRQFKPEGIMDYLWEPEHIKLCPDDGYVVTGIKNFVWYAGEGKERALWVFKTDENGYYSLD